MLGGEEELTQQARGLDDASTDPMYHGDPRAALPGETPDRRMAMAISFGVFSTMMLFGFRTFGSAAQALILNNYHRTADPLASLARLATGCSILCGYPLMFAALKASFFSAAAEISGKFGEAGGKMAHRFLGDEGLRTSECLGCARLRPRGSMLAGFPAVERCRFRWRGPVGGYAKTPKLWEWMELSGGYRARRTGRGLPPPSCRPQRAEPH